MPTYLATGQKIEISSQKGCKVINLHPFCVTVIGYSNPKYSNPKMDRERLRLRSAVGVRWLSGVEALFFS